MANKTVNYERFPSSYFSGSNIKIYFNNIFLDEATSLQFVLQEKTLPINGYMSYTFDDIARGSRLVQGQLSINYKDENYLNSLAEAAMVRENDNDQNLSLSEEIGVKKNSDSQEVKELLLDYMKKGWSSQFDSLSNDLENRIWNQDDSINKSAQGRSYFPNKKKTFDIVIEYGPYYRDYLEEIEKVHAENINKGTVKRIKNIQLNSIQERIDSSGKPIQEVYGFIAEDIVRN